MKNTFLLIALLITNYVWGQDMPFDNLAYRVMPDQNAVGNSGSDVSVNLYTGQLNAGFPLFTYENKSCNLTNAITLNYNYGSGVKVDDIVSNVGLGWSINTGGYITRQVMGLRDEEPSWGFTSSPAEPIIGPNDITALGGYTGFSTLTGFPLFDGQFDIYDFNAGGTTGKFIIGKDNQIITIPQSNIKITKQDNVTVGRCTSSVFNITLENGVQYVYNVFDCQDDLPSGDKWPTTWYLTGIFSQQDNISFSYDTVFHVHQDQIYSDVNLLNGNLANCNGGRISSTHSYTSQRISHINYSNGTVINFLYSSFSRIDFYPDNALESISITNSGSSYAYKFNYRYILNSDNSMFPYQDYSNSNYNQETYSANFNYRLQLDGFYKTANSVNLPGYSFIYNTQTGLSPNNGPTGIDIWGYNDIGEPRLHAPLSIDPTDLSSTEARSLQQINFPTGGNVQINYQQNDTKTTFGNISFQGIGGLRVAQLTFNDGINPSNAIIKQYNYVESDGHTSSGVIANYPQFTCVFHGAPRTSAGVVGSANNPWSGLTNCTLPLTGDYIFNSDVPLNYQLYTKGSIVGYDRVEEYIGTVANYLQKNVYKYTVASDYTIQSTLPGNYPSTNLINNGAPFPYIPDLDFACGLLSGKEVYGADGQLQMLTENHYTIDQVPLNDANHIGIKVVPIASNPTSISDFSYAYTYPITGRASLTSTDVTQYFDNNHSKTDHVDYTYDGTYHVLRTKQGKDALGNPLLFKYYYPFDLPANSGSPYITLWNENRLYDPIRVEKWNSNQSLLDVSASDFNQYTVGQQSFTLNSSLYDFIHTQPVTQGAWNANINALLPLPSNFLLTATMDGYDAYENLAQVTSKGITSSTIWGYYGHYPIAKITNAPLNDVAYTSFDDDFVYTSFGSDNHTYGLWSISSTPQIVSGGITGSKACNISSCTFTKTLNVNKTYILSFWTNTGTSPTIQITVAGGPLTVTPTASDHHLGWTLYKYEISNATAVSIGNQSNVIDELRLYPKGAEMTTYTYNPLFGKITSATDAANRTMYSQYDDFGRLLYEKDIDGNIVKSYEYKFQESQY